MELNNDKVYLGDTEIYKIYLDDILIKGVDGGSNTPSTTWTLTRKTNGEVMAEFEFSPGELPENISYNGVTLFQITKISSDGTSYTVTELYNGIMVNDTEVDTNSSFSPVTFDPDTVSWTFTLPSPYHIEINCVPM